MPFVRFYSQGGYPQVYLQEKSTFSLVVKEPTLPPSDQVFSHRIDVKPYQCTNVDPIGNMEKTYYQNFYLPWTAPNGAAEVYGYDRVIYEDIYPEIDMLFYSGSAGQKLAFYCWPGSDPTKLALQFFGQDSLKVQDNGELKVWLSGRWVKLNEAAAYQVGPGGDIIPLNWAATYNEMTEDDVVNFIFDDCDPGLPIVLQIGAMPMGMSTETEGLCWGTYFGGAGLDQILASTHDVDGNYYVTGFAGSDFMSFQDATGTDLVGLPNAVLVAKFSQFYELEWMVFYGGYNDQFGNAIKTRTYENGVQTTHIFVGGYTVSPSLYVVPLTGAYNAGTATGPNSKGFIARFRTNGTIDWSTYFGNDNGERVEGLDFDAQGRLHLVGSCNSTYPQQTLSGATNLSYGGGFSDIMVARFGFNGNLEWCTSIGGSGNDYGADIACHSNGFYVSGRSSGNFPTAGGGAANLGGDDVVLLDFNNAALLQWSHHHGGSGYDRPGLNSLAVDGGNNLIVVGETQSNNITTQSAGGFYMPINSNTAGFIARYASGSHALQWSSYVSGESENVLESVTVAGDRIFAAGYTEDYNFPVQAFGDLYFQDAIISPITFTNQGGIDGIVMGFEGNTNLAYSTYFGGEQGWFADNIYTTDFHADQLYLGGVTSKHLDPFSYFPLDDAGGPPAYLDESYDPAPTNYTDGFLAAICTETFTDLAEWNANASAAFVMQPGENGHWIAKGLEEGRHQLSVHDAKGALVLQGSVYSDGQRTSSFALPALAGGTYLCVAKGPSSEHAARFHVTQR